MDWTLYIMIGAAVLVLFLVVVVIVIWRIRQSPGTDVQAILDALGVGNVATVQFKRNKIHATLKDYNASNPQALKAAGAVGVNVVGNVAKFYFEDDTEAVYDALKAKLQETDKPVQ